MINKENGTDKMEIWKIRVFFMVKEIRRFFLMSISYSRWKGPFILRYTLQVILKRTRDLHMGMVR